MFYATWKMSLSAAAVCVLASGASPPDHAYLGWRLDRYTPLEMASPRRPDPLSPPYLRTLAIRYDLWQLSFLLFSGDWRRHSTAISWCYQQDDVSGQRSRTFYRPVRLPRSAPYCRCPWRRRRLALSAHYDSAIRRARRPVPVLCRAAANERRN